MLTNKRKLLSLIAAVAIGIIFIWVKKQIEIDSCLDLGSKWDYDRDECYKLK
jgi:hypothetical protein